MPKSRKRVDREETRAAARARLTATKKNSKAKAGKGRSSRNSPGKVAPGRKPVPRNIMKTNRARELAALRQARATAWEAFVSTYRTFPTTASRRKLLHWLDYRLGLQDVDAANWLDVLVGELEQAKGELQRVSLYPEDDE